MEVLPGKLHSSSLAVVENDLGAIGDVVEARKDLSECVLFMMSVNVLDIICYNPHIIAPPDGRAP